MESGAWFTAEQVIAAAERRISKVDGIVDEMNERTVRKYMGGWRNNGVGSLWWKRPLTMEEAREFARYDMFGTPGDVWKNKWMPYYLSFLYAAKAEPLQGELYLTVKAINILGLERST